MMRLLLLTAVAALAALPSAAQVAEPLFVHRAATAAVSGSVPADGRAAIVRRAEVGLRIDRLFAAQGAAARVFLDTGEHAWTARFERLDTDAAGFRSWVGAIENIPDSHVVVTERDGFVSGLINAIGTTYQIRTDVPGSYVLEEVDITRLGDERDPVAIAGSGAPHLDAMDVAADDGSTIDVLMLYTPSARAQRGGTASIESLISQIISDTNTAFARSGMLPRVRLVATAREIAIVEAPACSPSTDVACGMSADLATLRTQAAPLRDELRADLVQLLVNSPDLSTCGVGYLLSPPGSSSFPAYSVADIACAAQYTPTHEMGHNMGAHHAPEDGAYGGWTDFARGFKDSVRQFRTVMAYGCESVSCGRILNLSNPTVGFNGGPTGTGTQDNSRSLNEAAFTVANFRQALPPPTITPPHAPTGLRSSVVGNAVTVAWDAVLSDGGIVQSSAASGYVLQVGSVPGAANLFNASTGSATSASGMAADGVYYWRVIAMNSAGASSPSAEAQFIVGTPCIAPSAPRNFIFGVTGSHVTLAWTPPATGSGPVSYIGEVGSAAGLADLLVAPVGPVTSVGTPAPAGTYFVRVRAQNACGTSAPSNEQVITVP
ncbi:MAG TPA: M12 family metallo-peptidase [Vicinamibacterales bacterium]|nr:M12 family metallo-peptidase [Vicinamibacterales bacterium]